MSVWKEEKKQSIQYRIYRKKHRLPFLKEALNAKINKENNHLWCSSQSKEEWEPVTHKDACI